MPEENVYFDLAPQRIQNVICARRDMSWEFPALCLKHDYCTIATQTALDDGGARRQSCSQGHTDFDLAPYTS